MLQPARSRFHALAAQAIRHSMTGGAVAAALSCMALEAPAQIVRPAIGRYHEGRVEQRNADRIQGRYLERQALPGYEERQTHLGWEVRGETYVVTANTSRDDALRAARAIEETWNETLRMADYWTDSHRQPNFSVAAISVHIDQNPRRDRQEGDLRFVNQQTHVYLNVADEETSLDDQLDKLRASTVHAFWRRGEFDLKLPTWVRSGLASYVATQQALANGEPAPAAGVNLNVYDPYWERGRITADELEPPEPPSEDDALRVRYLLEGDDARHAPWFFAAIEEAINEPLPRDDFQARAYQTNDRIERSTAVDQLFEQVGHGIAQWISNPMVDQPQLVPIDGETTVDQTQQHMAFILKLAHRQNFPSRSAVTPKVVGGEASAQVGPSGPAPSVPRLWHDLTNPAGPPWATLDPQGNLLLSDQTDRLRELFQAPGGAYRTVQHNGRWALETRVDRYTRLLAWMEDNPNSPRQPLVKFERITDKPLAGQVYGGDNPNQRRP